MTRLMGSRGLASYIACSMAIGCASCWEKFIEASYQQEHSADTMDVK